MQRSASRLPEPPPAIGGRIAVVGVCGAGKSTLVDALRRLGYDARQCGQEHSYVPDMWQRISRPEVLVYLEASPEAARRRHPVPLGDARFAEQRRRLSHARNHCHIYVDTDHLTAEEVLQAVLRALPVSLRRAADGDPR